MTRGRQTTLVRFAAQVVAGAAACAVALACVGCVSGDGSGADASTTQSFTAMDTGMTLTINASDQATADDAAQACEQRIHELDELLSPVGEQSAIELLNDTVEEVNYFSPDLLPLFETAFSVASETDGAFDPTVYPVTSAWGFTSGDYRVPSDAELAELLPLVDFNRVRIDTSTGAVVLSRGTQVDVGGVAKGFAADNLRDILKGRGVSSALFDLGGNVTAVGSKPDGAPWKVGVANPAAPDQLMGTLELRDATASTSGSYQRFFTDESGVRRHHLIDPATGYPADSGLASVTVIGPDGARCDALSTALYVKGLEGALEVWRDAVEPFEAVLVDNGGAVFVTEGIADTFTPDAGFADRVTVVNR